MRSARNVRALRPVSDEEKEDPRMIAELAQKSGGKMQVKLFPGGVLGGDVQVLSAVQGGTRYIRLVTWVAAPRWISA